MSFSAAASTAAALVALSGPVGYAEASTPHAFPAEELPSRKGLIALLASQLERAVGWPWDDPAGPAALNTGGVIANALVQARAHVDTPAVWITLAQYAAHLDGLYSERESPYMADITFLARVNDEKLAPNGSARARALFSRVKTRAPTGADEYARLASLRGPAQRALLGYDVALAIDAAVSVGERGYAYALADAAVANGHHRLSDPRDSFGVTSAGALSRSLMGLDAERYESEIVAALTALEAAQAPNGSWAVNNSQATAYAVAALRAAGIADGATTRAEGWLIQSQGQSGDWRSYDDGLAISRGPYIPLVQADVLAAMLAASR